MKGISRRPARGGVDGVSRQSCAPTVLEAADIADGYILACQSLALTPEVCITY